VKIDRRAKASGAWRRTGHNQPDPAACAWRRGTAGAGATVRVGTIDLAVAIIVEAIEALFGRRDARLLVHCRISSICGAVCLTADRRTINGRVGDLRIRRRRIDDIALAADTSARRAARSRSGRSSLAARRHTGATRGS